MDTEVVNFEDARAIGWRVRPWWWGGWGTYHVAPWGMADGAGWLLSVGAFEWLWRGEQRYRPEPGTPFYFVTLAGEPLFVDPSPQARARVHGMAPAGTWFAHPWLEALPDATDTYDPQRQ